MVDDDKIKLFGMASTLQCDVTLKPKEALLLAKLFLKPSVIKVCFASLFQQAKS